MPCLAASNVTRGAAKVKPVLVEWAARRRWKAQDDEADALLLLAYSTVIADKIGKASFLRHGELL